MIKWFRRYADTPDEELPGFIAGGDQKAFEELYKRYSQRMLRYFHRMLWKDKEKAEDFMQDIFLKIIRDPSAFDPKRKFSTWIYSVAHNMCKNEYRKQSIRHQTDYEEAIELHAAEGIGPEMQIDVRRFRNLVYEELEQLDETQRTTFLLRYEESFSIREISQVLDCSEGTVKSRLFYTLKKLAAKLHHYNPNKDLEKHEKVQEIRS
jgi:RNA polymerase sigma-70 factor, ECF subfamily